MSESSIALTLHTAQPPALQAARRYLTVQHEAIARRLAPFGISAERYTALVLTELSRTPSLLECMNTEKGQASLQMAVFEMAQHGLEPGPLQHVYLIPRRNKSERFMAATFMFGWRGMVQLALRSPNVKAIDVQPVYPEDKFDWRRGTRPSITHVPVYEGPPNYSRLIYVYAIAFTRAGGTPFVVLSKPQIEHYRRKSQQPDGEAWGDNANAVGMALKTGVRRGFPLWPVRVQELQAVAEEEAREEAPADDDGTAADGADAAPPPIQPARDRRRRTRTAQAPPPDAPAAPGARRAAEPPPPDRPAEPGGSMTPLQFLAFACEQAEIDRDQLLVAVHGEDLRLPPTADQVRRAIEAARAISQGQARLVELDGRPQLLPVVDDGEPADGGQTRMPGT